MRSTPGAALLAVLVLAAPSAAPAATYTIDRDHSTVGFKIRHLVSNVRGQFNEFEGTISYTPGQPDTWRAKATIKAESIDTNVAARDTHLRSADFFDTANFPTLSFTSTAVTEATDANATLRGELTLHGVTKPVVLDVQLLGEGTDPWGNTRAGFTATATINRKDFGLAWNKALEAGQFLVGDEVELILEIEALKQGD